MTDPSRATVDPGLLTETLARFAADLRYEDVPPEVMGHARLCLLDTMGCGLFGSTLPWVTIVRDMVRDQGANGPAALWGSGVATTSTNAALVNGTAVHAFELDDLHRRSIVHPGSVATSAGLAVARPGKHSGRDVLTALVAGYEVATRVGQSLGVAHLVQGWHPTGTHGALGAAAAAGRLLGLTPEQMTHAIGTAGSMSSGLMAAQFSSMVKRLHAGHAAQSGVTAALLAHRGFTGTRDLLENSYGGYLSTFSPSSTPELILSGLGQRWETQAVGFKPYSTNGSCHTSIDALLEMRRTTHFGPQDVDRVEIACSTATLKHVGWPYRPDSVTTAQMNLPYIVAVVITDGDAFVDQFTQARISDPALVELAGRVDAVGDRAIDAGGDDLRHAIRISVHLRDGRVLTDERHHAKGSPSSPMTTSDIAAKFEKLAVKAVDEPTAKRLRTCIEHLATQEDLQELLTLLSSGRRGM